MARHRRRPNDDYSDGSNSDSPDDVSLSDEDEVFDVEVDDAGYETSPTDIDDEESNDTGDFGDDCDDFDIEDQVQLFDGNLHPREYYLKQLKEFSEAAYDDEDYSEGSTILFDGIEELWNKYCAWFEYDPQESFESVSLGSLYNFFDWLLGQKAGKNGRKKRGTKKSSLLGTYWKVFRLVYERATGAKLDAKLNRKMHRITLGTMEKSFSLGELRILCVLFLLLLAPTGARLASVLKLRYRDIRVVLSRDLDGGPYKVLIGFTLEFTKTYLGIKDAKTVTLLEILFDDSLMFSPHVFLEGILFRHRAFEAPSLTCPDAIGNVSDATRNLMLDHANSNPFQRHYLGCQFAVDSYALIRALEFIGYSISKRRPAHDKPRSAKQTQRRALKDKIREQWTNKQAVIDIENQLAGLGFVEEPAIRKSNRPRRPAQKRLMDALTAPVESTVEGQHRRRDVAIYAVMTYCVVVEGPAVRRTNSGAGTMRRSSAKDEPREDSYYAEDGRRAAVLSVFIASLALRLEPGDPCIEELTHEFYSAGDLNHKRHLQRHALQIHGTVS
ncbi:hypothetical protein B0T19DRAFT_397983 [Cercophora scortea]|uniref:Uncharacterized protein n=1 Tax=Cercophora scortea TaxID=314031 RepID=A0AAE0IVW3_9PEZI|nr:hypothetical protein B0T19DRAFT_397983 [Cercophora scortea]